MPSPSVAIQRTFSDEENVVGSDWRDAEIPEQFGPRNWGQSSPDARQNPNTMVSTMLTSAIRYCRSQAGRFLPATLKQLLDRVSFGQQVERSALAVGRFEI